MITIIAHYCESEMYNDLAVIFQSPDVYVQAERKPPKMSLFVASTFPRYGTSTVLPSEAL